MASAWEDFAKWLRDLTRQSKGGRGALRRRWQHLRGLADEALAQISDAEIRMLLGRERHELDPELNDLKAIVAYAAGRGVLAHPERLPQALDADETADPLAFLAALSGKSFGEKWAPEIASYWLCDEGDRWEKKKSSDFYDAGWFPQELRGREIRIELKASSEHPSYRFQQIRHPRLNGASSGYDVLLCVGVTAGSLDWWVVPTQNLDELAENGTTLAGSIVLTVHHGKRRPIWNEKVGYKDEAWFVTDARARVLLSQFFAQSENLRAAVLRAAAP